MFHQSPFGEIEIEKRPLPGDVGSRVDEMSESFGAVRNGAGGELGELDSTGLVIISTLLRG